jgi:uncharacterized UPF0160 family protein
MRGCFLTISNSKITLPGAAQSKELQSYDLHQLEQNQTFQHPSRLSSVGRAKLS